MFSDVSAGDRHGESEAHLHGAGERQEDGGTHRRGQAALRS